MVDGYSPVPFADFWAQFPFIERGLRGDFGLGDLWAQHNEHRIARRTGPVPARLPTLRRHERLSLRSPSRRPALLLAATFAAGRVARHAGLARWRSARWPSPGTATMSPAGIENLTWAFQVQFVQVFFFAALAVLAVVVAGRSATASRQSRSDGRGAALAAIAATYSMANGFLVWPVVVGTRSRPCACQVRLTGRPGGRRCSRRCARSSGTTSSAPRGSALRPVDLLKFVAVYLGSAVWGAGETAAALVGAFGLCAVRAAVRSRVEAARRARSCVIPFGAGRRRVRHARRPAQTAVGRLHLGTAQALASRYSIGSFAFWLALLASTLPLIRAVARLGVAGRSRCYSACAAARRARSSATGRSPSTRFCPTVVFGKKADGRGVPRRSRATLSGAVTGVEGGPGRDGGASAGWSAEQPRPVGAGRDGRRPCALPLPSGATARVLPRRRSKPNEPVTGGTSAAWAGSRRRTGEPTSRNLVVLDADGSGSGARARRRAPPGRARLRVRDSELVGIRRVRARGAWTAPLARCCSSAKIAGRRVCRLPAR